MTEVGAGSARASRCSELAPSPAANAARTTPPQAPARAMLFIGCLSQPGCRSRPPGCNGRRRGLFFAGEARILARMDPEQAYRGVVARCPACASPMEVRAAGDAEIDVCPTCRGMWLDWFDGDTVSLVELAMPLSRRPSAPMLAEPRCPRCERNLASDAHATSDTSVWRCGECAGTFLPRA